MSINMAKKVSDFVESGNLLQIYYKFYKYIIQVLLYKTREKRLY